MINPPSSFKAGLMKKEQKKPQHIAIIMDGNGRWARRRGLPNILGHRAGAKAVDRIVRAGREMGIKVLTLFAFSTENWKRPEKEVKGLFELLDQYLDKEEPGLNKNNIRLMMIGRIEGLPDPTQERLKRVMDSTGKNTGMVLNLALDYGARSEIVDAVRKIGRCIKEGAISPEEIDEKRFSSFLYTKGLPDPDLLIRTSGEFRISNFLLWQISYCELYVTSKLWPDFKKADLEKAVNEYQKRERRFGG